MYKHDFNIFPEMQGEEMERLINDIKAHGFDSTQPIIVFEGQVLDGWNRHLASETLGVEAKYKDFEGSEIDAINFVMRSNKRRNLTSQQWAAIAVDAENIVSAIQESTERERRAKQAESLKETHSNGQFGVSDNLLSDTPFQDLTYELDEHANKTATKLAQNFNTNRTYVNQAAKLKKAAPEQFEQLKQGTTTFQQIKKEKPNVNEILDDARTNEKTRLCKDFGKRFAKTISDFESLKDEMATAFGDGTFPLEKFAQSLLTTNLQGQRIEARNLQKIVKCPTCKAKAKNCGACREKGYVTETSEANINLYNEHQSKNGGAVNV